MCCFDKPYYPDGNPVPYIGHIDDFCEVDCGCLCWDRENFNTYISEPGVYAAGHTGCWYFYFDGEKVYQPHDILPHEMYWKHEDMWDILEKNKAAGLI